MFENPAQPSPEPGELRQLLFNLFNLPLQHAPYALTGSLAGITDSQNLADFVEAEPNGLRVAYKAEPGEGIGRIHTVATGTARDARQQAQAFVVANRLHTYARQAGQLADSSAILHGRDTRPYSQL